MAYPGQPSTSIWPPLNLGRHCIEVIPRAELAYCLSSYTAGAEVALSEHERYF